MEPKIEGQKKEVGQESTSVLSGKEIESLRKRLGSTQKEVAEQIGVTASMVSKIERGLAKPSQEVNSKLKNWVKIAHECALSDKSRTKSCWKCKCVLPESAFGIDRSRGNGRQSKCLNCNVLSVKTWRKANWDKFLVKKRLKRKIDSSVKRNAGHRWVSDGERARKELLQLVEPDALRIRSIGSNLSRRDLNDTKSYIDEYGEKIRRAYERGIISELQARRLASLTATRSPTSF
jgi:DNA-binding XRE family transcriptional regulator